MAVLLAVNEGLLSCEVPSEDKAKEIVKNAIQKVVKKYEEADMDAHPDSEGGSA